MAEEVTANMSINEQRPAPAAIILAAGKGTRMGGDLPKVLHKVADKPMVYWVVKACKEAGVEKCVIVIGYKGELVKDALAGEQGVEFVEQTEQLGTGHAAQMAQPAFENHPATDVFVLAGDGPLIRAKTLARLLEVHRRRRAASTMATAVIDDPSGYGRVVRNEAGEFDAIVEQKDATPAQLEINEVNPSYYCFASDALFGGLSEVDNKNQQGEYYLTDVPGLLKQQGQTVAVVDAVPAEDILSINTPQQLGVVDGILRERINQPTA
ncbi:NTP transferase domain-containing protein [Poriferisphaera sp. WC338]|uniref:NTP transferase domain-containing protein n=1 Tax=Poriferisphaera sp. WC338 TaxID=3425129 RepID=UPI003D81A0B1